MWFSDSGEASGTTKPVTPSNTASAMPPTDVVITGGPGHEDLRWFVEARAF